MGFESRRVAVDTQWISGQPKVGRSQHFSRELEKGHVSQRQGGASETYCSRKRHNGRQTQRAGERTHLSASPVMHHLSILPRKEMATVADESPRSQEKNRAELSTRDWKRENYYFLSKWFWFELQLNLVWDGTNIKHRSYTVTEPLQSYRLLDVVTPSHPDPSLSHNQN